MDLGATTHPGYVRDGNEDGYFVSAEYGVFAVADGMGGHEHGEVASRLAMEEIARQAEKISTATPTELPVLLHEAVQAANAAIINQAEQAQVRNRMGTTLVLATICGSRLYFAHIGDSRLYLLRGETFTQLTRDHSLVQAMVDRGEITPEEAAIHPLRHQITRVVGGDPLVSPEIASQALEPGDLLLLCTDGLSGVVPVERLKEILAGPRSSQEKTGALVQAALDMGGPDNITVVAVHYQEPRLTLPAAPTLPAHAKHVPFWQWLVIGVLSLVLLATGVGVWGITHPAYYVSEDGQQHIALFHRWPLLPMLAPQRIVAGYNPVVTAEEARPFLPITDDPYGMIPTVPMPDSDAGISYLHDLQDKVVSGLLEHAKSAIEQHELMAARAALTRAKTLQADPALVKQLEAALALAEKAGAKNDAPAAVKK